MKIYFGTDHAGFELKESLKSFVALLGHEVIDFGANEYDKDDDYPDFIAPVARTVSKDSGSRGIILGGSGQGEAITANRVLGVRAVVYYGGDKEVIKLSRIHNNANILSLGARFLSDTEAKEAVRIWLETEFSGEERHKRRIKKIDERNDFDTWNGNKIYTDSLKPHTFFKERDIFYIKLGKNIGSEQDGKNSDFGRPVLVFKKFNNDIFWGIPLSTTKKKGRYYFHFSFSGDINSVAILSQMRLFDGRRLMNKKGVMSNNNFLDIKEKIRNLL